MANNMLNRSPKKTSTYIQFLIILLALLSPGCKSTNNKPVNAAENEVVFGETSHRLIQNLADERFHWISVNTRHFRIYFERNSYASENLDILKELAEESVSHALRIIGETSYDEGIILLVVDSEEKMNDLIGMSVKGFYFLGTDMLYTVYNENIRPYLKHEIMHKISISYLGEPPKWLREGSAMYADGTCLDYENPLDVIPACMMRQGLLLPVDDLVNRFDELTRQNDLITYLESGSIFKYIYEKDGWETIVKLWKSAPDKFPEILGESYKDFESEWRGYLSTIDVSKVDFDWDELMDKGCG
jgi:hypothetical protein